MELLTRDERRQVIVLLLHLPNIDDPHQRRRLLADLPLGLQANINFSDRPDAHITQIIDQVTSPAWRQLHDGSWPLLTVLENARDMVQGSRLMTDIQKMLDTLQARTNVVAPVPAPGPILAPASTTSSFANDAGKQATQGARVAGPPLPWLVGGVLALLLIISIGVAWWVINPPREAARFGGEWVTNFGSMTLDQSSGHVSGDYRAEIPAKYGTVEGNVTGDVLTGIWRQGNLAGRMRLTISAAGNTIDGLWDDDSTLRWCGARIGVRFPAGCGFDGEWLTNLDGKFTCAMTLKQIGTVVTGTYCQQYSDLRGDVTYASGMAILTGTYRVGNERRPFTLYLPHQFNSVQFVGNYLGNNPWCGMREGKPAPDPEDCLYPKP